MSTLEDSVKMCVGVDRKKTQFQRKVFASSTPVVSYNTDEGRRLSQTFMLLINGRQAFIVNRNDMFFLRGVNNND